MRRMAFVWVGVVALAGVVASAAPRSGQADGEAAAKGGQAQAPAVAKSGDDLATKLTRREIQRSPSSIPGREIVQVETLIPAGVESGWHAHPGEEVGYIIAGQVEMMVQGRAIVVLHAGDGFLIPPRTPHNARDVGPETGRMLSTYIVETGQPIATFVDQPLSGRVLTQYPPRARAFVLREGTCVLSYSAAASAAWRPCDTSRGSCGGAQMSRSLS